MTPPLHKKAMSRSCTIAKNTEPIDSENCRNILSQFGINSVKILSGVTFDHQPKKSSDAYDLLIPNIWNTIVIDLGSRCHATSTQSGRSTDI